MINAPDPELLRRKFNELSARERLEVVVCATAPIAWLVIHVVITRMHGPGLGWLALGGWVLTMLWLLGKRYLAERRLSSAFKKSHVEAHGIRLLPGVPEGLSIPEVRPGAATYHDDHDSHDEIGLHDHTFTEPRDVFELDLTIRPRFAETVWEVTGLAFDAINPSDNPVVADGHDAFFRAGCFILRRQVLDGIPDPESPGTSVIGPARVLLVAAVLRSVRELGVSYRYTEMSRLTLPVRVDSNDAHERYVAERQTQRELAAPTPPA